MRKCHKFLECCIYGALALGFAVPPAYATGCPTKENPFLVQIVAVGVGPGLKAAKRAAKSSLKKRATLVRENFGFPLVHEMFLGLTPDLQTIPGPPQKPTTTATVTAWYELNIAEGKMIPLPSRCVGNAAGIIQEHDVVHDQGY